MSRLEKQWVDAWAAVGRPRKTFDTSADVVTVRKVARHAKAKSCRDLDVAPGGVGFDRAPLVGRTRCRLGVASGCCRDADVDANPHGHHDSGNSGALSTTYLSRRQVAGVCEGGGWWR